MDETKPTPKSAGDRPVGSGGWTLVALLQMLAGTSVVTNFFGFDGISRWWAYPIFLFLGGFTGTLSPVRTVLRANGGAARVRVIWVSSITGKSVCTGEATRSAAPRGRATWVAPRAEGPRRFRPEGGGCQLRRKGLL
jgi:hypothetical protein